jgi:hypothetical protein
VFAVPSLAGNEVARPHLMADLISKVITPEAGIVGMTTALRGAGGFGKTTLARMLVHDPTVRQAFPDGIAWVTIGEDAHGADLAARSTMSPKPSPVASRRCRTRPWPARP